MITPTSAPGLFAATAAQGAGPVGRDQFLTLLVAQLRNQDPLSPLEPHEFAAQLAQFTSVEQLTQLNDGMAWQTQSIDLVRLMGEATFSSTLLGRAVVVEGSQVEIPASGAGSIRIDAGGKGTAELRLLDASGNVVATRDLGTLEKGRQTVALPDDLPPGKYTYEVKITDADGKNVPVARFTTGTVDGVFFRQGRIILKLGLLEVAMDGLSEILPPPAST